MADPSVPVQISFNLAELWALIGGGGGLSLLAGALGYKKIASKNGVPSQACPLNGRFNAVENMNKTMTELATHLRDFTTSVQLQHNQQHEEQLLQTSILQKCTESIAILTDRTSK